MAYLLIISVAYEVPQLKDAKKIKDLIIKDDPQTYVKIKEIK